LWPKNAVQQLGTQYYTLSDWRSKRNAAAKMGITTFDALFSLFLGQFALGTE
jgi:hypothetical protein